MNRVFAFDDNTTSECGTECGSVASDFVSEDEDDEAVKRTSILQKRRRHTHHPAGIAGTVSAHQQRHRNTVHATSHQHSSTQEKPRGRRHLIDIYQYQAKTSGKKERDSAMKIQDFDADCSSKSGGGSSKKRRRSVK